MSGKVFVGGKDTTFKYRTVFHWKFWKPVECIGGRVYFGEYVICGCVENGFISFSRQTPDQVAIKQRLGLFQDAVPCGFIGTTLDVNGDVIAQVE